MQVGVGTVAFYNASIVNRGGANIRNSLPYWLGAENCSELCYYGMLWSGLGNYWYQLPLYDGGYDPRYLKCIEASGAAPLNGLRLQHASQFNTLEVDPLVPQMNITDWKACMRIHFI